MEEFKINDLVNYGWKIGSHYGWSETAYHYKGHTALGHYILETLDDHSVFIAKLIKKVGD